MANGLYWRGLRNAADLHLTCNSIVSKKLPEAFDGFTILHLSELHIELMGLLPERIAALFTSDNGDVEGEHRVTDANDYLYEPAARSPLYWLQPGGYDEPCDHQLSKCINEVSIQPCS